MTGTNTPTTFPIDFTPPRMTNAVNTMSVSPVTIIGTPNDVLSARLIEFVWTPLPIPNAAMAANKANVMPSQRFFKPCSK